MSLNELADRTFDDSKLTPAQKDLRDQVAITLFFNQTRAHAIDAILFDREFYPLNIFARSEERCEAKKILKAHKIDLNIQTIFKRYYKELPSGLSDPVAALQTFRALTKHVSEKGGQSEADAELVAIGAIDFLLTIRSYQATSDIKDHYSLETLATRLFKEGNIELRKSYSEAWKKSDAEGFDLGINTPNLCNRDGLIAARIHAAEMLLEGKDIVCCEG